MATRRIPISSSSTNSRRASQPAEPTRYASSLDAVFSFQRSAAFFGDNLQTGPSFVDKAHYPAAFDDDDDADDVEGRQAARWRQQDEDDELGDDEGEQTDDTAPMTQSREASVQAPWADGNGGSAATTGEVSPDSDSGPPSGLLVDTTTTRTGSSGLDAHALPPNAIARSAGASRGSHRRRADETSTTAAMTAGEASERSPLLARTRTRPGRDMFQVGGDSSSDYLSTGKAGDSSGIYSHDHASARRASVFSREVWKAKIEAHRGESTWGQTLFNT